VQEHLSELVVKEVNGSGGYGMLVGPHATSEQISLFSKKLAADPQNFIAQPTLALSTCPASFSHGVAPRHVDLRPFILSGADKVRVVPGGLTRVALKEGSLVVNSSQGGGTKDTWIVEDDLFDVTGEASQNRYVGGSQSQTQSQGFGAGQSQSQSEG
jgi:uncharacterized circularly permuted ATP-grasp superfamily protein